MIAKRKREGKRQTALGIALVAKTCDDVIRDNGWFRREADKACHTLRGVDRPVGRCRCLTRPNKEIAGKERRKPRNETALASLGLPFKWNKHLKPLTRQIGFGNPATVGFYLCQIPSWFTQFRRHAAVPCADRGIKPVIGGKSNAAAKLGGIGMTVHGHAAGAKMSFNCR